MTEASTRLQISTSSPRFSPLQGLGGYLSGAWGVGLVDAADNLDKKGRARQILTDKGSGSKASVKAVNECLPKVRTIA